MIRLYFAGSRVGKVQFYARVTFAYEADNEDELSLDVGKVIEVLGDVEDGWWKGRFGGKEGVFPENFVEKLSEADAEAHKKKSEPKPDLPGKRTLSGVFRWGRGGRAPYPRA